MKAIKRFIRECVEALGYRLQWRGHFGFDLAQDLKQLIGSRQNPTIIDVGANDGQSVVVFKDIFPDAKVICFEPDSRAREELEIKVSRMSGVRVVPAAAGEEPGVMTFWRNVSSLTSSLLVPTGATPDLPYAENLMPFDAVSVEVVRLDRDPFVNDLRRVDLLKTDCQGYDLRVLRGADGLFARRVVKNVLVEAIFHQEYEDQGWFHEILPFLMDRGFSFMGLYEVQRGAGDRVLFGNALFAVTT